MYNYIAELGKSLMRKVLFGYYSNNTEDVWEINEPKDSGILGWVYYVPDLETTCIVYPDYVDYENGLPPVEWGLGQLPPDDFYLDAKKESIKRNCIYLGEL